MTSNLPPVICNDIFASTMNEHGRSLANVKELVEELKLTDDELNVFLSQALEDVYFSGQYTSAVISGNIEGEEKVNLIGARVVGIKGDELVSLSFSVPGARDAGVSDKLIELTQGLKIDAEVLKPAVGVAIDKFMDTGLRAIAMLQVAEKLSTREEVVEVYYPNVFKEVFDFSKEGREVLALSLAALFLKEAPLGHEYFPPEDRGLIH